MKREEAIKILKELHDGALFSVRNALETLIPELAESEDERIRKHIIDIIKDNAELKCIPCDSEIAYLEKQKEPLPVPDKFSGLKSLMLQYLQSAANRKDDAEIESDTDLFGRKILDYVWKQDEKQKEQMPAEWSKEDEDMFVSVLHFLNTNRINKRGKVITWVKSLPKRFNLQPKQEWSEEDEKMLEILISNYEFLSKKYRDEEKDFFCSLSIVRDDLDMSEWIEKRLKSLRPQPHWKPSEEQMKTLEYYMHTLICNKNKEILFGLYSDLKKL